MDGAFLFVGIAGQEMIDRPDAKLTEQQNNEVADLSVGDGTSASANTVTVEEHDAL